MAFEQCRSVLSKEPTMLFITNCYPTQGIKTKVGRNFSFDKSINEPLSSVFFCERYADGSMKEIGSSNLMKSIKDCKYRQILFYIHGFANQPEDVFESAAELQGLCDKLKRDEVMVIPLIWPCTDAGSIVQNYWDDQKSADKSAFGFARLLEKFIKWRESAENSPETDPCLKRINILAHSMGNRVLRETLVKWDKYDLKSIGVPYIFRNTFMVAADVVNETLESGKPGAHICHSARNVVVYYASDDLALRASKGANLRNKIASRRLGHTGVEDMTAVSNNVFGVDCDDFNNKYDSPKGHSYFRSGTKKGQPGVVFRHIFSTILTGRVKGKAQQRNTSVLSLS